MPSNGGYLNPNPGIISRRMVSFCIYLYEIIITKKGVHNILISITTCQDHKIVAFQWWILQPRPRYYFKSKDSFFPFQDIISKKTAQHGPQREEKSETKNSSVGESNPTEEKEKPYETIEAAEKINKMIKESCGG